LVGVDFRVQIGRRLAAHRTARGLSQEDLAGMAKLTVSQISRIENGKSDPKAGTLIRLATGLEIPVAELLEGPQ
jgi:transcriptional regulator with XRE-family HTH domain